MKKIVISAVNLVEGGTLTILQQCLSHLNLFMKSNPEFKVIAIVHDKNQCYFNHIDYIEIKDAKKSWLNRIYYEYIYFYRLSVKIEPYLWLSLHDMSPRVHSKIRAVYCHNSTPFYKSKFQDLKYSYKFFLFTLFYKYLYKVNIKKNDFVIVQQDWLRTEFVRMYNLNKQSVIVAYPINTEGEQEDVVETLSLKTSSEKVFFYPALSRPFKNFEVICEATIVLKKKGISGFKVFLTLDGREDEYAKWLYKKYGNIDNIKFVGRLSNEGMKRYYGLTDCLLFPSKLETWGLPISEFSMYNKPMIIANLPYAHETASSAKKVSFFSVENSEELAYKMEKVINDDMEIFKECPDKTVHPPYVTSWSKMFDILLKK